MNYEIGSRRGYQFQGNGQKKIHDSIEQNGENEKRRYTK